MKVFLSIGNQKLEEVIKEADFEIVDYEDNLTSVYDLLDFISIDAIIINRLLDDEQADMLIKIAKKAKKKGIKLVVLIEGFENYEERKVVTSLVNEDVTAFIKFDELTTDLLQDTLKNYPKEFDFSVFSKPKVEYRDVVQSVFKKVIAVYSPTSEGTSTIAAHLAHGIADSKQCKVCLIDFNPLKPRLTEIFDMSFDFTLKDVLESVVKKNLSPVVLESYARESKYIRNLDVIGGLYEINDFYTSKKEEYEEIIEKAKFNYDYVILDTHSWYDLYPTDRALYLADDVIVPVRGRKHSIDTVDRYLSSFGNYNDFDIRKFKLLINKYNGDDLTSLEITAKTKYPITGYISEFKDYDRLNGFKNKKLMNEYVPVLKELGIEAKKKGTIKDTFKSIFKKRV